MAVGAIEHIPNGFQSAVFIPLTVFNHGSPSVITGWGTRATLSDGKQNEGQPTLYGSKLSFQGPNKLDVTLDQALFKRGALPIPTGGEADGYVLFVFSDTSLSQLKRPGTLITLTLKDITHREYQLKIPIGEKSDDQRLLLPPGMVDATTNAKK
jgi:hypothetical protein